MNKRISIFDMFKIGVGPSSSHTMGPWRAAERFLSEANCTSATRIVVELFGSLAKTGKGHGTDIAVQLGLSGEDPETIDVAKIDAKIESIAQNKQLLLAGATPLDFESDRDILFHFDQQLPYHPNAIRFTAHQDETILSQQTYFSIGGGFVVTESDGDEVSDDALPFPIDSGAELLAHCESQSCRIADIVWQNELTWRSESEIRAGVSAIHDAMVASIHRGCRTDGILPGGLQVHRRAAKLTKIQLEGTCPTSLGKWKQAICQQSRSFQSVLDWVSCFALAVNEENAAYGRIVTAPTNGAAGVIPAVMFYCECFCDVDPDFYLDFLLTAGEIGSIFKKGATISAAMGGCQAEIGVSSAMAAAALAETLGGTPAQAAEAAEIAMEHHLGMTCDPIAGLVQIPCIERNAMGAIKAITAAQMAVQRDTQKTRVSLDAVVETMWQTAQDMNAKYKETSEGGLAVQIPVNISEC